VIKPGKQKSDILTSDTNLEELYKTHGMMLLGNSKSAEEEYIMFNKLYFKENTENQRIIRNQSIFDQVMKILTHRVTQ
jgi:hypothetical protein